MHKKKTLTVGIPAHNESATILRVIRQILEQHSEQYVLENIIVACDGCSDNTAELVSEFAETHSVIRLINDGQQRGKATRLASFYHNNKSDVFVSFDADVDLGSTDVLDNLVLIFSNPKVGLVGGYDIPKRGESYIEKVIVTSIDMWLHTREWINGGDSVHNHHGCVSALSKDFCREVQFDTSIVSDDEYLYLRAKELGYSFVFCRDALVYYQAPATLSDYFRQSARFMLFKQSLGEKFGNWIEALYYVPLNNKVRGVIKTFLNHPLYIVPAIVLQLYSRAVATKYLDKNLTGGVWSGISSTKK